MVTGKITAVCGVPGSTFPAIKPGAPQVLAYAASSVQSAALGCVVVRVVSTTDCHIAFGANSTAAANSIVLLANWDLADTVGVAHFPSIFPDRSVIGIARLHVVCFSIAGSVAA
jgi:hypothetical protein